MCHWQWFSHWHYLSRSEIHEPTQQQSRGRKISVSIFLTSMLMHSFVLHFRTTSWNYYMLSMPSLMCPFEAFDFFNWVAHSFFPFFFRHRWWMFCCCFFGLGIWRSPIPPIVVWINIFAISASWHNTIYGPPWVFSISWAPFCWYSRQLATAETIELLLNLAEECGVKQRIADMFAGVKINNTEKRSVLHVALRASSTWPWWQKFRLQVPISLSPGVSIFIE